MLPSRNPVLVSDIVAALLENGGIRSTTPPVLYLWKDSGRVVRRIEIKTLEEFLSLFGVGTYQVYIENPDIDHVDSKKFRVNSLSIVTSYTGDGKWSEPILQTDEEEVTPDYSRDFKAKATRRAARIAGRVQGTLTILSILYEAYKIIRGIRG
jgi:hypothetical protein